MSFSFVNRLRAPVPFAAARIFALVSGDGRLSLDGALVLEALTLPDVALVVRTVVLTLALDCTLGNLTLLFDLALVLAGVFALAVFVVFLVVSVFCFVAGCLFRVVEVETEVRVLETAFLTPYWAERGVARFRFLFRHDADSSMTLPIFRFVVVALAFVVELELL